MTQAFLLAAAASVIIRAKALPVWLGWSAAVIALVLLGGLPLAFFNGFPLQLLPMVWVLVTSIVLVIRAGRPASYASYVQPSAFQSTGVQQ